MDSHVSTDPQSPPLTVVMETTHVDSLPPGFQDASSSADQYICAECGSAHADIQMLQQHFRESHLENGVLLDPKTFIGYLVQECPCQCEHGQDSSPTEGSSQQASPIEEPCQQNLPAAKSEDYPEQLALDDFESSPNSKTTQGT